MNNDDYDDDDDDEDDEDDDKDREHLSARSSKKGSAFFHLARYLSRHQVARYVTREKTPINFRFVAVFCHVIATAA